MTRRVAVSDLLTLDDLVARLHYGDLDDPTRAAKRLLKRHGIPVMKRGRVWLITEGDYQRLQQAMHKPTDNKPARGPKCSPSGAGGPAGRGTAAAPSGSARKRATSRNTVQDYVTQALQRRTVRGSRRKSKTTSFTVVTGGQHG